MAKKKLTDEDRPVPPEAPPKKPRSSDRHKPRKMVALKPRLYRQLQALADQNRRPLQWEINIALEAHLQAAGLWPPPAEETGDEE